MPGYYTPYQAPFYNFGAFNPAVPDQFAQNRGMQGMAPQITPQAIPQNPASVPNAQQGSNSGLIWVQGEAGAKSYLVAPGTTVMLMDSENQVFYLKSADASGMPLPLRKFPYYEETAQQPTGAANFAPQGANGFDPSNYITREEFERRMASVAPVAGVAMPVEHQTAKEESVNG